MPETEQMLLSSSQNTSSTAAVWQEHQQEGRVAAEVSKEACDALNQGHRASMTSRASLTLPVVQISLSSRVGQSNSFSTTGQGRTHVFQWLHIPSFEMSLVQPKPIVGKDPVLACPLHHHSKSGWSWGYWQEGDTEFQNTEETYIYILTGIKNMEAGRWEAGICDTWSKHRPKQSRIQSTQPG